MEYVEQGSASAFSELYRRFEARLYGFLTRRLAFESKSLAPDLFQKTWLKVHHARGQFEPSRKFSTWIFTIAHNTLRDEWRLSSASTPIDDPSDLDALPSTDDVELTFARKEELIQLEAALTQISESQREALILSDWEGFSTREVSETIGVAEATARQLISRARRRVRQIMKGEVP